jgi:hypothetical protein
MVSNHKYEKQNSGKNTLLAVPEDPSEDNHPDHPETSHLSFPFGDID